MAVIGKDLVDQVKEFGIKATLAQRADDLFTRATAGLSWNDVRSILRGDPPPKPNPRVYPHTEAFWFHIRPSFYHEAVTTLYPTFRLGYLSALFFLIEIITGMFLMVFYTPSPERAYKDMIDIMTNVPFGTFMRDLHRLGAELMVIIVTLHMWRTFATGSYKTPRQFTWFTGLLLLVITGFLSFSGYLLPWDQLALWAVTIGASMIEATPPQIVGDNLNLLLRGGPDIGANGILRFYLLHIFLLPGIAIALISVHYYAVRKQEISPIHELFDNMAPTKRKVPFLPDQVYFEIAVPGEAAGVDVDRRHGFQLVDHQIATRAQRHLPVERARDLLFDLVHGKQRPRIAVVLDLAGIRRHEGAQEFADAGKFSFVVDDYPADAMRAFVAQHPHT